MTKGEAAQAAVRVVVDFEDGRATLAALIVRELLAATENEREACAVLCERVRVRTWSPEECAHQIRTRGDS